jgi:hypothetical protein
MAERSFSITRLPGFGTIAMLTFVLLYLPILTLVVFSFNAAAIHVALGRLFASMVRGRVPEPAGARSLDALALAGRDRVGHRDHRGGHGRARHHTHQPVSWPDADLRADQPAA